MTMQILGRREDQHFELKSRDALDSPDKIARAVVGMLNADGGEVWIGVDEEDSTAVSITPIPGAARAQERLLDCLVDMIDPSPTAEEVTIRLEPADADSALLVVHVHAPGNASDRRPFALRKGGGWHFLRRVGARNHPMARPEIFGRRSLESEDRELSKAIEVLERDRKTFREAGGTGLWLGLQPAQRIHLDVQSDRLVQLTLDPALTGNRRTGLHFARSSRQPEPTKDGIEWGLWSEHVRRFITRVKVNENGSLRFWAALERLHRNGEEHELWPLVLLEYPISAFRIARVLYEGLLGTDGLVVADPALFGIDGWSLRKGSHHEDLFFGNDLSAPQEEPDLVWEPVVFRFREIDEHPDRCGFRLVRRVYQAFGLRESDMPREYDVETGRLLLPE